MLEGRELPAVFLDEAEVVPFLDLGSYAFCEVGGDDVAGLGDGEACGMQDLPGVEVDDLGHVFS
jgi:hypothetical protein